MRQYAIIGLGSFGQRMLEKLSEVSAELIIVDKDEEIIERFKDRAQSAYVVDSIDAVTLGKILPANLDVAIVDMQDSIEAAILATNSLKKLGVQEIIVRADSEERGEVFTLVGATRVVFPDREAAARIVPILVSPSLFSFMPIGSNFVMAEVQVPPSYIGMSLIEANLRQRHGINVVALRPEGSSDYRYFSADYRLSGADILLVAGSEKDVVGFSGKEGRSAKAGNGETLKALLKGKGSRPPRG